MKKYMKQLGTVATACVLLAGCGQAAMKDDKMMESSSMMKDGKMDDKKMDDKKMDDKNMSDNKMKDDKMMESSSMSDKSNMKDDMMKNKGEMAPSFKLMDVNGKVHTLEEYKGKKVFIKAWASWCSICLSTLQETQELAKNEKDFVVLTIVAPNYRNEKSKEDFLKWFNGTSYTDLPVLFDENGEYFQKLGVVGYPSELFIGSDGTLVKQQTGYMSAMDIKEFMKTVN
ncbi:redoxin family protein [Granulicatella sp. zg-ZJ]|uniref:TlpA family protein disulfide reductase n=1 Tax=unclassified Granulicatella TaxID=2630493 RepID=UPI0013C0439C|nr:MULTISPECIES: redoxin family protein [unclassified Granulicatella]MBS4751021.1 redoxin family protein [Carnobacteriaceae bacterium zg-ZUI78]NEW62833.1 redoxin family protein [Granulicatella sp. zg-ZJ]NEW65475.1 redoxin family protein [Granulicatella sp. zg-84]QMI85268.1 redoxin family protein [Carnobacteriaceae bacterium zg-84]